MSSTKARTLLNPVMPQPQVEPMSENGEFESRTELRTYQLTYLLAYLLAYLEPGLEMRLGQGDVCGALEVSDLAEGLRYT